MADGRSFKMVQAGWNCQYIIRIIGFYCLKEIIGHRGLDFFLPRFGGEPGIFWFCLFSLSSSALDHSATAPPPRLRFFVQFQGISVLLPLATVEEAASGEPRKKASLQDQLDLVLQGSEVRVGRRRREVPRQFHF